MSDVEFAVLGPLEARRAGQVLDLGGPRQRAVLAFLLTHRREPVSLDRMIDELWGEDAPPKATASLQAYVSNLRRILEPDRAPRAPARILVSRPPGYALDIEPEAVDAIRFEQAADEARHALAAGDPAAALSHAERARSEWRGEVLADFPYDDFAVTERNRLADRRVGLEQDKAAALLDLDRPADAAEVAETLAVEHPLREQVWELLMLARYRTGRQAEALRAFQDARRVLAEELGLEPGPSLRRLEEQILAQDPSLDRGAAATPSTPDVLVTNAPAGPAAIEAPAGPLLVGRSAELDRLTVALRSAASGRAAFALVSGEAGIGKTTLVRAAVERSGLPVVWGRSQEQASDGALWPWRQVVQALVPAGDGDPTLAQLTAGAGVDLGTSVDRLQLYDAVTRVLAARTPAEPAVVVLEDIHWADTDTLRLLDYLATELQSGATAVVATFRPDEAGAPAVAATLGSLARRGDLARVELTGLGAEHVRSFAHEVGGLELDAPAAEALHGRTAGNPFFLTELVRLLAAERGRRSDEGIEASTVPASVRDVVRRRIERLPDDSRTVLSVAAVAGAAVGIDVLAETCGIPADAALDALEPPFLTGLVEEAGPSGDQVRFAHALVAETLNADLPAIRRRRLHGRIADAIEAVHRADLDDHLASLAHHHGQAAPIGHAAAATRYAVLAARQAERRGAVYESARLWADAGASAELDPASTPADRLDLAVEAALALGRSGDQGTRSKVVEAIDRAEALGDTAGMARAARALMAHATSWTWTDMRTRHEDVIARLERTLARLGEDDSRDRARLLGYLALGVYSDERRRSLALAEEGVAMAARLGDEELRGECLNTQIVVLNDLDQHASRRKAADDLIEVGERLGRHRMLLAGLVSRIDWYIITGDVPAAEADVARAETVLGREPDPPIRTQLAHFLPRRLLIEGHFDEAEAENERAYELRRVMSLWWGAEESFFSVLFDIRREQGRLIEMLPWFDTDIGDERVLIVNLHAQVLVEEGRIDEARALLGPQGIRRPIEDWWWIAEAITAVELACELDDATTGAELRQQLLPFSGLLACNGTITTAPPVDLYLGRLDRLVGDRPGARAHLQAALDMAVRIGAPSFEAHAAVRLGLLLREDGDTVAAAPHLDRAAELAERDDLRRVARLLPT